ncbi:hypothetical protein BD626DRAFT_423922 [Schizophyllum amplum]|uniref:Amidohydrolase-related domain-containing protein n=1 Tax=Schizophyllum amplum TaxID=97359 RepID=A0A550CS80_9AGAR|nr:hypothetical protein BD626DRAFT_423922 [Auriculariopsis ampla]
MKVVDLSLSTGAPSTPWQTLRHISTLSALCTAALVYFSTRQPALDSTPVNAQHVLTRCAAVQAAAGPSADFFARNASDRFEPGTPPTLVLNVTLFTGENNGSEVRKADLLLENGLVKSIGELFRVREEYETTELQVVDMHGAWVTPGLVDLNSHIGVLSTPILDGAADDDSHYGPILPWLRSIDAFNTHDDAFALAIAGGVTSALILPGSTNAIGGQGFMIKLRATRERSPTSMAVELPHQLSASSAHSSHVPWRHMKQACGEPLRRHGTRMDTMWALRAAYEQAREVRRAQDAFCGAAQAGSWQGLGEYPESLQWEALVDVLRGNVKVGVTSDCSEAVDLDAIARLSNEFEFHVASLQGAADAWLVPGLLKRMWGGPPAMSLFATNHRHSRQTYWGSEFAPRVLADNNITVVLSTSHPTLPARDLIREARQAHYHGLNASLALAAVTAFPAEAAGLAHRLGVLRERADADLVVWSAHPLQQGAVPMQVWIDGIAQLAGGDKWPEEGKRMTEGKRSSKDGRLSQHSRQRAPRPPTWDAERERAVRHGGVPPLDGRRVTGRVVFSNVRRVWEGGDDIGTADFYVDNEEAGNKSEEMEEKLKTVVVEGGRITCVGEEDEDCDDARSAGEYVDLKGGEIAPGMVAFGSPLGMGEIASEASTQNGLPWDPMQRNPPKVLGDPAGLQRAVDGLVCDTRDALLAYRSGVTYATTVPSASFLDMDLSPVIQGLSVTFRTGCHSVMERGTIVREVTALHVAIGREPPLLQGESPLPHGPRARRTSVSQQIALLRRLLQGWESEDTETGKWFKRAAEGAIPLIIHVESADIMATLLILKAEIENRIGSAMRVVFAGASEAPLLARDLVRARVGVILTPARPVPNLWEGRRILPGPPLTNETSVGVLLQQGVTVGLGVSETWAMRNVRFEVAQVLHETRGLEDKDAVKLVTTNLANMLGIQQSSNADVVAYRGGGLLELESKVVGVLSAERGFVDLFEA